MGIVVVFGTSFATIMGIFLIPMLFILVEKLGAGKEPHGNANPGTIGNLKDMCRFKIHMLQKAERESLFVLWLNHDK